MRIVDNAKVSVEPVTVAERLPSCIAYDVATDEQRASIDRMIAAIDERLMAKREDRDRRQSKQYFEGVERRNGDRRENRS